MVLSFFSLPRQHGIHNQQIQLNENKEQEKSKLNKSLVPLPGFHKTFHFLSNAENVYRSLFFF